MRAGNGPGWVFLELSWDLLGLIGISWDFWDLLGF